MATITRTDGTVIAWGGEVEGPTTILSPMGQSSGFVSFKSTIAVNGELRGFTISVHEPAMWLLGTQGDANRDRRSRELIVRFIQQRCENGACKLVEDKEHFTLYEREIRQLLESVTKSPEKLKCTVRIPMSGGDPESYEIEVFDERNAIPMLRNRLPQKQAYRWDEASVVKKETTA